MRLIFDENGVSKFLKLGLSSGCFQTEEFTSISQEVPSYWADGNDLEKDYLKICEYYQFSLNVIFNLINSHKDIKESFDYCRILTSPWALTFTMIVFEKYYSISKLIGQNSIAFESDIVESDFILENSADLFNYSQSDKYNKSIIIDILIAIQEYRSSDNSMAIKLSLDDRIFLNYPTKLKPDIQPIDYKFKARVVDFIKYKATLLSEFLMNLKTRNNKVVLFLIPEFRLIDVIKIYFNQKSSFKILHSLKHPKERDLKMCREYSKYSRIAEKDELSFVLQKIILKKIPREFLENFILYKKDAEKLIDDSLSAVVTRAPTDTNPIVRHVLALSNKFKIRTISMQHGGGYNNYVNHPLDLLERELVDEYLVWGDMSMKPSRNVGITRTSWFNLYPKKYYNNEGCLLIVAPVLRRYYSGNFGHVDSFASSYKNNMQLFLDTLQSSFYKKLVYRMGWDYGVGESNWISAISPEISISNRELVSHAYKDVLRSRIVVCTYNSTLWLELSRINHPFILLIDFRYDLKTKMNEEVFSIMEDNDMLFYDSEQAARHVMRCFDNPMDWWRKSQIQEVRNKINDAFCQSFDAHKFAKSLLF